MAEQRDKGQTADVLRACICEMGGDLRNSRCHVERCLTPGCNEEGHYCECEFREWAPMKWMKDWYENTVLPALEERDQAKRDAIDARLEAQDARDALRVAREELS
jgi:hypothetical protein